MVSTPLYSSIFLATPTGYVIWRARPGHRPPSFFIVYFENCSSQGTAHPAFSLSSLQTTLHKAPPGHRPPSFLIVYFENCSSQGTAHLAFVLSLSFSLFLPPLYLFFPKAVSGGGSCCGLNSSLFIYFPCDPTPR